MKSCGSREKSFALTIESGEGGAQWGWGDHEKPTAQIEHVDLLLGSFVPRERRKHEQ